MTACSAEGDDRREAKSSGRYGFRVYSNDFTSIFVRFSVVDRAEAACDAEKPRT